jgi:hypothetical protein
MRSSLLISFIILLSLATSCTTEFVPVTRENQDLLVVDGMITDEDRINRIRLSRSMPIGEPLVSKAVSGAIVTITDENGVISTLKESPPGTYATDSTEFRGRIGGFYSLNIRLNNQFYETDFVEMKPVPPIDSLYYEKVVITSSKDSADIDEGCRIYVDSYDPSGKCLYFRWNFEETWEYQIPYNVVNKVCYVSDQSNSIIIKNTSLYSQARVTNFPVHFISNESDRLKETYSILVKQYSLDEAEFNFWDRVKSVSQNIGNLYDVTPSSISGNINCVTDPGQTVLGYFSVSAVAEKRLFIDDQFLGLPVFYTYCATDTARGSLPPDGLNSEYWVIEDYSDEIPPFWVLTTFKECADCTTRGTGVQPPYWPSKSTRK